MVVSGLLIKFPYWIGWKLRQLAGCLDGLVFYVDMEHDYQNIEYILPHLKTPYVIAARNRNVAKRLKTRGIPVRVWPVFPSLLIMTRHAFHRFPIDTLKKIGLKHGPGFFKKMIHPAKYNAFDLYLFCSQAELAKAAEAGVRCGAIGGYPRIDAFSDSRVVERSREIEGFEEFRNEKTNLLFTATWDRSGQSGYQAWIGQLALLAKRYNIAVSLHPLMKASHHKRLKAISGIRIVQTDSLPAYMIWADMMVGDTSSVLAEFCVLDKPMITFSVQGGARLTPEIKEMIREFSTQVTDASELDEAVANYLDNPSHKRENRQKWKRMLFDDTEVSHGKIAADIINQFIEKQ